MKYGLISQATCNSSERGRYVINIQDLLHWKKKIYILTDMPVIIAQIKSLWLLWLKKIVFQYCVCVRSFEHFCGGRNMVSQYGDSGRSFPKDSIFACKTKSVSASTHIAL